MYNSFPAWTAFQQMFQANIQSDQSTKDVWGWFQCYLRWGVAPRMLYQRFHRRKYSSKKIMKESKNGVLIPSFHTKKKGRYNIEGGM